MATCKRVRETEVGFSSFCITAACYVEGVASVACATCHRQSLTLIIIAGVRDGGHNFPRYPAAGIRGPRSGSAVPSLRVLLQTISHLGLQCVLMSFEDAETCPRYISERLQI